MAAKSWSRKAILIAIAIPTFTGQLEKAREASEAANIHAKYSEVIIQALDTPNGASIEKSCTMTQQQNGWQNADFRTGISNLLTTGTSNSIPELTANGTAKYVWVPCGPSVEGYVKL